MFVHLGHLSMACHPYTKTRREALIQLRHIQKQPAAQLFLEHLSIVEKTTVEVFAL